MPERFADWLRGVLHCWLGWFEHRYPGVWTIEHDDGRRQEIAICLDCREERRVTRFSNGAVMAQRIARNVYGHRKA